MSVRTRLLGAVLVPLAVVAAFWFLALSPKRAEIAKVKDATAQAAARRDAALGAAASAGKARAAYDRDYANLARLGKAAPADDDVASLVYQVESVARANKIDFRAVKLSSGAAAAAPAPASAESGKSSGDKSAGADTTTPATATPTAPPIAQAPPGAVVGPAGLLTLPFALTFDGGYMPMQRMLGAIDRLADATDGTISVRGRLVTIDGFALTASRLGFPKVKALVSATAYIVPPAGDAAVGTSPQAPAAGSAPAAAAPGSGATAPVTSTATIQGTG